MPSQSDCEKAKGALAQLAALINGNRPQRTEAGMTRAVALAPSRSLVSLDPVDEERAIAIMMDWAASVKRDFNHDFSNEWVAKMLRHALRTGLVNVVGVIEAAEKRGDPLADDALRKVGAELMERRSGRPGEAQILAYLQRVADRPLHGRKRGGDWTNNWRRDFILCAMIEILFRELGLSPTRNRESRRADNYPSGCSLIVKLWARQGVHLEETRVQNIWGGLTGRLTREAFAQGPLAFLYPGEPDR